MLGYIPRITYFCSFTKQIWTESRLKGWNKFIFTVFYL